LRLLIALSLACVIGGTASEAQSVNGEMPLTERFERQMAEAEAALVQLDLLRSTVSPPEAQARLDTVASLELQVQDIERSPVEANLLLTTTMVALTSARAQLGEALDALHLKSTIPSFVPKLEPAALQGSSIADQLPRLEQQLVQISTETARLRDLEQSARWQRLDQEREIVRRLNAVRIGSLSQISNRRRAQMLGLSRDGIQQLNRELGHLSLMGASYFQLTWHQFGSLRDRLGDVFTMGSVAFSALKLFIVLALYGWIRRRSDSWIISYAETAKDRSVRHSARRRIESLFRVLRAIAPWALWLLTLRVVLWAIGSAANWPEIQLLYALARLHAIYRLAVDLLVAAIIAMVRLYRFEFGAKRTKKLLESTRTLLRVLFSVFVLLTLSAQFLGYGYLYHVVARIAFIALFVTLVIVFRRWQSDVADAYLTWGTPGRLKNLIQQNRDRWIGGLYAAVALLALAALATLRLTRDFVMGFDQTRRALAFLFRRRIEKQAELAGYANDEDESVTLPDALEQALDEGPLQDDRLAVDYYPGLDRLNEAIERWVETTRGGSFLLSGDFGVGRTSWLNQIQSDQLPIDRVTFDRRISSASELVKELAPGLGFEESSEGQPKIERRSELRDALNEGPRRIIIIDRGQNLFLGRVGGYEGFESFVTLVEETSEQIFWVISFSQLAWDHINAVHPDLTGFRHKQKLEPWPEEKIRELIRKRAEASGSVVIYDDLLLQTRDMVARREAVAETEEGYARLLWDTCRGMPRIALHYWKRSLVPEPSNPQRVRVRLFRPPPVSALDELGYVPLFILASLSVHESLTTRELAVVTRYPARLCRLQMARLEGLGVVRRDGIRWWPTSYWQPTIYRQLRRRNLLTE
jgi:hypothetical protein